MKPLDSIAKRDLLAAEKFDPEAVKAYADAFFSEERYGDALAFYIKIDSSIDIQRVKEAAIRLGNPDILWQVSHSNREAVSRKDWLACGKNAMRLEKFHSAAYVFERIGEGELLAEAEKEFKPPSETEPESDQDTVAAEA